MDSRLTCCRDRRRQVDDSWALRRLFVNAILTVSLLLGFYLLINWQNIRCSDLPGFLSSAPWCSSLAEDNCREQPQDFVLPIVLGTAVVAMISILHVVFKVPSWPLFSPAPAVTTSRGKSGAFRPKLADEPVNTRYQRWGEEAGSTPGPGAAATDEKIDVFIKSDDITSTVSDPLDKPQVTDDDEVASNDAILLTHSPTQLTAKGQPTTWKQEETPLLCLNEKPALTGQLCEGDMHNTDVSKALDDKRPLPDMKDTATQTDEICEPDTMTVGTMMTYPQLADAAVNTHERLFKIVKSCGTTTSGPFMKKLRRAQRLLKEAKERSRLEKQARIMKWKAIICRYKEKLYGLSETLDKKDRLLGYTALNRALSENEVKEMSSAVRCHTSARDRLHTQCKLNSALREVIESKCDTVSTVGRQSNQTCR